MAFGVHGLTPPATRAKQSRSECAKRSASERASVSRLKINGYLAATVALAICSAPRSSSLENGIKMPGVPKWSSSAATFQPAPRNDDVDVVQDIHQFDGLRNALDVRVHDLGSADSKARKDEHFRHHAFPAEQRSAPTRETQGRVPNEAASHCRL